MTSATTMKHFNKCANSLIDDYNNHLESNGIIVSDEIKHSFLIEKPSKRKGKLSPYSVFMKENRSNFQKEHPELSFQEVSQILAQEWAKIKENPEKCQEYEEKAKKYNQDMPNKQKKICQAKKGSDKQPCQAEARYGDYCGRHKKLAFDQVDADQESQDSDNEEQIDYLTCQRNDCTQPANSGPFCKDCSKKEKKTKKEIKKCSHEKPNGQECGKKATKGDFCGFHDPNKKKRTKKRQRAQSEESSQSSSEASSLSSPPTIEKTVMYYDEHMKIHKTPLENRVKFIIYDDNIAYNDEGDEIGIIKNGTLELF